MAINLNYIEKPNQSLLLLSSMVDEPSVLLAVGLASSFFASSAALAAALLALEGRPRRGLGASLLVSLLAVVVEAPELEAL